jgi:hypothetical protein
MNKATKTVATLAVAGLLAAAAAGCSTNEDRDDPPRSGDKDRDGIPNRVDPRPNRPDDVYDRDRAGGSVRGVPRDAVRLEKDEGPEMRVRPNRDGRIFVYDPRADRIAYEGRLREKEEFVLDSDRGSITIDGRRVDDVRLSRDVRYELYYLRDADRDTRP